MCGVYRSGVRDRCCFRRRSGVPLHEQVALRPEPFGALRHHYGNRRPRCLGELVTLVESLADTTPCMPPRRRRDRSSSLAQLRTALACSPPLTSLSRMRDAHEGLSHDLIEEPAPTTSSCRRRSSPACRTDEAGARRPDLSHVGTHLRLQPQCALPVVAGRRDPRELTTEECEAVIDELHGCRSSTSIWRRTHDSQGLHLASATLSTTASA